ncbi:MAG: RNase adapter RapZ, partial [Pseudomonadota bacterium]
LGALAKMPDLSVHLIFLDCSTNVLLRRFSETRRRHPLSPDGNVLAGIEAELALVAPLREGADILIDTTEMSPHDLRAELGRWFGQPTETGLSTSVQSFSYKRGTPRSADLVFDCRFLSNPHWEAELRPMTGLDREVAAHVSSDPLYGPFLERILDLARFLLPAYTAEGKSYLTLAFGCTGGRHRSVAVAEAVMKALAGEGWRVSTRHRELERLSVGGAGRKRVVSA